MDARNSSNGRVGRGRRLGRRVWLWYLTAGIVLAVTRVSLFVSMVRRAIRHGQTEADSLLMDWLFPEVVAVYTWHRLQGLTGAEYYWAYGSIVTVGSFLLATPVLLVGWLRRRRTTSRPAR
jgi:hypothetical protein